MWHILSFEILQKTKALLLVGAVDGTTLGTGKMIVYFVPKNTALGMPDRCFSIIDEKPFFNLNLQISVHPIHHFRRRCSFRSGSHENRIEQTTYLLLMSGLFEPIF